MTSTLPDISLSVHFPSLVHILLYLQNTLILLDIGVDLLLGRRAGREGQDFDDTVGRLVIVDVHALKHQPRLPNVRRM